MTEDAGQIPPVPAADSLDLAWMRLAIDQAHNAWTVGEVPVGAVLVREGRVLATGYNRPISSHDATAHAEIGALRAAGALLANYRLVDCDLYVTLEPCVMCAGALRWAQIGRIVYGAGDDKYGFMKFGKEILHPKTKLEYGLLESECSAIIKQFFKSKRK